MKRSVVAFVLFFLVLSLAPCGFGGSLKVSGFTDSDVGFENVEVVRVDGSDFVRLREEIPMGWSQSDWKQGPGVGSWGPSHENAYRYGENVCGTEGVGLEYVVKDYVSSQVLISEIYPDGRDEDSEFVEIYNPTSGDVELGGWRLEEESGNATTFDSESVIPAYGYYLIGFSEGTKDNSDWPDAGINADWSLANDGEYLVLSDNSGRGVDNFAYGSDSEFGEGGGYGGPIREGFSLERKSGLVHRAGEGNGYDTEKNSRDFLEREKPRPQGSTSSPERPPGGYEPSGVVVSSVFDARSSVGIGRFEWSSREPVSKTVEVFGARDEPVELADGNARIGVKQTDECNGVLKPDGICERVGEEGTGHFWTQTAWRGTSSESCVAIITGDNSSFCDGYIREDNLSLGDVLRIENTLIPGSESNLLEGYNRGFESSASLEAWEELGTAGEITRSRLRSHSGTYSCRFSDFSDLMASYEGRAIRSNIGGRAEQVLPGENYSVSAWFLVENDEVGVDASEVDLMMIVEWYDSSWNYISENVVSALDPPTPLETWRERSFGDFVSPENAAYSRLRIEAREENNRDYSLYIDDVGIFGPSPSSAHKSSAYMESSIYDSGRENTRWSEISWEGSEPEGTHIEVRIRFGNSLGPDGLLGENWIVCGEAPYNLGGRRVRYVQYSVGGNTENLWRSPSLESIHLRSVMESQSPRWQHTIENVKTGFENYVIEVRGSTIGDSENVEVAIRSFENNTWENIGTLGQISGVVTRDIQGSDIRDYLQVNEFSIKYESADSTDSTQTIVCLDRCALRAENLYETSADLYVRASSSGSSWTDWKGPYSDPPADIDFRDNRFIQYKVKLSTEDNSISPTFDNFGLSYSFSPETGSFVSRPIKTGFVSSWKLSWSDEVPPGGSIEVRTRTSENGEEWSDWSEPLNNGSSVPSPGGGRRFLQIRADFTRSDLSGRSPELENYSLFYSPDGSPPEIEEVSRRTASSRARISAILFDRSLINHQDLKFYVDGRELDPTYRPLKDEVAAEATLDDGFHLVSLEAGV